MNWKNRVPQGRRNKESVPIDAGQALNSTPILTKISQGLDNLFDNFWEDLNRPKMAPWDGSLGTKGSRHYPIN